MCIIDSSKRQLANQKLQNAVSMNRTDSEPLAIVNISLSHILQPSNWCKFCIATMVMQQYCLPIGALQQLHFTTPVLLCLFYLSASAVPKMRRNCKLQSEGTIHSWPPVLGPEAFSGNHRKISPPSTLCVSVCMYTTNFH